MLSDGKSSKFPARWQCLMLLSDSTWNLSHGNRFCLFMIARKHRIENCADIRFRLAMLGWRVGMPAVAYVFASQILALIAVCNPSYTPTGWQGALTTIASASVTIVLSIYVMQTLSLTEDLAIFAHIVGFIAFLTILWTMGPKADAYTTFFHFEDQNGWGSFGVATLIGV